MYKDEHLTLGAAIFAKPLECLTFRSALVASSTANSFSDWRHAGRPLHLADLAVPIRRNGDGDALSEIAVPRSPDIELTGAFRRLACRRHQHVHPAGVARGHGHLRRLKDVLHPSRAAGYCGRITSRGAPPRKALMAATFRSVTGGRYGPGVVRARKKCFESGWKTF